MAGRDTHQNCDSGRSHHLYIFDEHSRVASAGAVRRSQIERHFMASGLRIVPQRAYPQTAV